MLRVRKASDRGHFNHGWLDTYHTFSFGGYYDLEHMGFRALRVINEDVIDPGQGFGMHPHRDMEIVTLVLSGMLEHRDSLGSGGVIRPGEMQRMTAGTGIRHSEFNPSPTEAVHLYQIWLLPERRGLEPSYGQRSFPETERQNRLQLVASPDGEGGALRIRQDAWLYLAALEAGRAVSHAIAQGRRAWVQVLRGVVEVNEQRLAQGDGAAVSDESALAIQAQDAADVLVFDLA